ncbi:DUF6233 domain-containing protein [Streptomyces sp. NPDC088747]|uniref:DUF6233 domain-containing protein n=1 Tax=Streptomyces sp. NPDC088747 TaxID=3365886 RepID=UPI0038009C00
MFDDLPPDLARLNALRVWHAMWLERIDRRIAAVRQREAEEEHGRRTRPQDPDWFAELGTGQGQPPTTLHAGGCYLAGRLRRAVDRTEALRLLDAGLPACAACRPDNDLAFLG